MRLRYGWSSVWVVPALLLCSAVVMAAPQGLIAVDKVANRIRFYDPVSVSEIEHIDGPGPTVHELALDPLHPLAYVPLYGDGIYGANRNPNNKVLIVDLLSRSVAAVIDLGGHRAPHGLVATRDGSLWVVCDLDNTLLRIDLASRQVVDSFDVPGVGAHQLLLQPDESRLYISNKQSAPQVFDLRQRRFMASLDVRAQAPGTGNGSGTEGMALSRDGRRLFIADNGQGAIHVFDTGSLKPLQGVPLQALAPSNAKRTRLIKLLVSPDGRWLVTTAYASGQVWIIDTRDLSRQKQVAVAKGPQGVAFAADGRTVLVASHDSGLLTRLELASGRDIQAYEGGEGIESLAFY